MDIQTTTLAAFQRAERVSALVETAELDGAEIDWITDGIDRLAEDGPDAIDVAWMHDSEGMADPVPCAHCRGPVDATDGYTERCPMVGPMHPDCRSDHYWTCAECVAE